MSSPLGRLQAEDPNRRRRLERSSTALVGVAGPIVSMLQRTPARRSALRWWARAARSALDVQLDVEGTVPAADGPFIVAPLHEGFGDILALATLELDLAFLARDELFAWPHLGPFLRSGAHVEVPTSPDVGGMRRIHEAVGASLARGRSVVAFPQGSILGLEVAFASGPFRLAASHDVPVLPVVLTGSHRVWEHPFSDLVRFGQRISMHILDTIAPGDAVARSAELERTMKRLALQPHMAPARRYVPARDGYWDGYDFDIDPSFPEVAAQLAAHRRTVSADLDAGGSSTRR